MGSILFGEFKSSGELDLPRFYVRRFLRLIPVYGVAMGLVLYFLHGLPGRPVWNNAENCWANLLYVNNLIPRTQQYMTLAQNFTLFSLEEPQSVRKIVMLSSAAGISGLMSKPPGGFVSARMNSRQRQRHRDTERQADATTNQSVKNAG